MASRAFQIGKNAAQSAAGIPDRDVYGNPLTLQPGMYPWVVQHHLAERAGPHYDVRLGGGPAGQELFSWAGRYLPEPGEKRLFSQQPLHAGSYATFQGRIDGRYGRGEVRRKDLGTALITKVSPNSIHFTVAHHGQPERFTLVRLPQRADQKRKWLLMNVTPTQAPQQPKQRYVQLDAENVEKVFDPKYLVSAKLDGAAALLKLLGDKIELVSYRPSKTGRPIVHTERFQPPDVKIPPRLRGSVLRGEIYGVRKGRAISAAELGGLLNASVEQSLAKQRDTDTQLRMALFGVHQRGRKAVPPETQFSTQREMLQEILKTLPPERFHEPPSAASPEEARRLWQQIISKRHPLTSEGIVAQPLAGGTPIKVKTHHEHDIHIREIFPGRGKLSGRAAGGFSYSLTPTGPIVGEVGTGFSAQDREDMWRNPEAWIGRRARIRAQEQFPSGAFRAPAFLARHEDY